MKAWLKKNPGACDVQVLKRFNKLPNAVVVTRASMGASERAALLQQLQRVFTAPELEHARDGLKAGAAIDGLAPAGAEVLESVDAWLD